MWCPSQLFRRLFPVSSAFDIFYSPQATFEERPRGIPHRSGADSSVLTHSGGFQTLSFGSRMAMRGAGSVSDLLLDTAGFCLVGKRWTSSERRLG